MDILQAISQIADTAKKVVDLSVYLTELVRKYMRGRHRKAQDKTESDVHSYLIDRLADNYSEALESRRKYTCLDLWLNVEQMLRQRELMVFNLQRLLEAKSDDEKTIYDACMELVVCTNSLSSMVDGFYLILTYLDDPNFRKIEPDVHKIMIATKAAGRFLQDKISWPIINSDGDTRKMFFALFDTPGVREKLLDLCGALKAMARYLAETEVVKIA